MKYIRTLYFRPNVWGAMVLILASLYACNENIDTHDWYSDAYLGNVKVTIIHPNPNTGLDYTQEELEALSYDPSEKESYLEGQPISLTLVSENEPQKVEVVDETNTVLRTISSFNEVDGKYHAQSFDASLDELGLLEADQKMKLGFKVGYTDGPPVRLDFEVKRIAEQAEQTEFYAFIKKRSGETIGLLTEESVSEKKSDPLRGTVLGFNGVDNKVKLIDIPQLDFKDTDDFSVGLWVNTTATNDDPSIIGDKDWGSGGNPGFVFAFTGGTWKLNAGDGSKRIDMNGLGPINDGQWHFLLVSFDRDGHATAYQDGLPVDSTDMSALGNMHSGLPIHLGQDGTGNYSYGLWYEGMIGQTFIYDYALNDTEAAQAYGTGVPTGAQFNKADGSISHIGVGTAGGPESLAEYNRVGFQFDGVDDLATWEDPEELSFRHTEDFTVSVWVNTTSTADDPAIISDKDWGSGGNPGFVFAFTGGTWKLNAGDGENRIDIGGLGPVNDGEWHLLTVSFDRDGDAVAYQDGVVVGQTDMSQIGNMDSGFPIRLAQDGTGNYSYGYWFEGQLANSMLFDYVLTPDQIMALYNGE